MEVKFSLPKRVYKWYTVVARRDRVSVEKVFEDALLELYRFKDGLKDVKNFYNLSGSHDGSTSLSHVLNYSLNLGLTLHSIAEHLLLELEGGNSFILSDVKLVQDEPGAYRGVCFEFIVREGSDLVADYFTLQVQHDGIYLDVTSALSFDSTKIANEAFKRLKKAAMKVVDEGEFKSMEEELSKKSGRLNIDISIEGSVIYLTFMVYANEINLLPKIHKIDGVLRRICNKAGIERT